MQTFDFDFQPDTLYHISLKNYSIIFPYTYDPQFKIFVIADTSLTPSTPLTPHAIFVDIHSPQTDQHFVASKI